MSDKTPETSLAVDPETEVVEVTEILNRQVGDAICYYRGYLARDRGAEPVKNRTEEQQAINDTANIAWKMYMAGKVNLTQRRHGMFDYEYIAIRRNENLGMPK